MDRAEHGRGGANNALFKTARRFAGFRRHHSRLDRMCFAQIVVLGHSAAHGYVAESEMWSSVLESMLRARGSQVHVTNAGVNGETTEAELARVDSAVPNGTKIVILTVNGFNDAHKLANGTANSAANVAAIKRKISARGIRIVDAMGTYISVLRQPGMALPDHLHLSVEGNRKMAAIVAGMVR